MTDDLVKRLYIAVNQFYGTHPCGLLKEAADRIEELEKNFELQLEWYLSNKRRLDDRIEELEAALRRMLIEFDFLIESGHLPDIRRDIIFDDARVALREKKDD